MLTSICSGGQLPSTLPLHTHMQKRQTQRMEGTHTRRGNCTFMLYIYDSLPDSYRKRGPPWCQGTSKSHTPPSKRCHLQPTALPSALGLPLWRVNNYAVADIFLERSLAHPCRTHDALRADLLLVPAWNMVRDM